MPDHEGYPIEGKVAQIISETELAINVGEKHGVQIGTKFAVLAAKPLEIRDPDTNELLKTLDREKTRVVATEVDDNVTLCRTYRRFYVPGGALGNLAGTSRLFEPARSERETLKAEDQQMPAPLEEEESYVKRGDRVREVFEEKP